MKDMEKEEEKMSIAKDCEVEVSCEEEGFVGAWYRAILEETPTRSGRKKLRVRYTTLLEEDCSTPMIETVEQRFIRPVPPDDPSLVLEEGSVVDADQNDGWWKGVVIKKMDDKFLVYFDSPPDMIQFDKKQLRPHFDWTGSEWVRSQNKVSEVQYSNENSHKRKRKRKRKQTNNSNPEKTSEALVAGTSGTDDYDQTLSSWILGLKPSTGSEALISSTRNNIFDDDHYDQTLSAWILGLKASNASHKSKKLSPDEGEDTTMVLPFAKRSPIWKALESMEVYKTAKQSPHFIHLLETREEFREGLAVGEMVNFSSLLERVNNLQPHTPKSTLEGLKECFSELDKYGFDVTTPISRINMSLSLVEKQVNPEGRLKDNAKLMKKEVHKRKKLDQKKDASEVQLCAEHLDKEIEDVDYGTTLSASW